MKNLRYILLLLSLIVGKMVFSQQFPMFSQYYKNLYIINPAVAGSDADNAPVRLGVHKQWLGIKDSPSTQYFSMHKKLTNPHLGVGGMIFHDKIGPVQTIGVSFTYAYHLELNRDLNLGFGLTGILMQYRLNLEEDDFKSFEPTLANNRFRQIIPDANLGVLLYHEDYWVGLSATQLFQTDIKSTSTYKEQSNQLVRHYFFTAGYDIKFQYSKNFELVPSVLIKMTEVTPIQFDLNTKLVFYEDFWVGASYRHNDSFVAMLGIRFDNYYFGYSHDFTFSDISRVTTGSDELTFGWNISNKSIRRWAIFD